MISAVVRKQNWWVRGALLLVMVFTLPVFFYFFVVGGVVSCGWLLLGTLPALLFPFNIFALVYGIHLVVYGFPLYWISGWLTRWVLLYAGWRRVAMLAALFALMIAIGAQRIFVVSHEPKSGVNAYEILFDPSMRPID